MKCQMCSGEKFRGPIHVLGLFDTVWNQYRCQQCGFTRHEPADDDETERRMLAAPSTEQQP